MQRHPQAAVSPQSSGRKVRRHEPSGVVSAFVRSLLAACQAPAASDSSQPADAAQLRRHRLPTTSATAMASPTASPSAAATPAPVVSHRVPASRASPGSRSTTVLLREEAWHRRQGGREDTRRALSSTSRVRPFSREADGHTWRARARTLPGYDEWPAQPSGQRDDVLNGWVAIGEGATPFLVPEPAGLSHRTDDGRCPRQQLCRATLVECFGSREITVKGTGRHRLRRLPPGRVRAVLARRSLRLRRSRHDGDASVLLLHAVRPRPTSVDRQRIQITGHFDDRGG